MSIREQIISLLNSSTILDINGYLIHNWEIVNNNAAKMLDETDSFLNFSYTDDNSYVFEFDFDFAAANDAKIVDNCISMVDTTGSLVDIKCFKLTAHTLN